MGGSLEDPTSDGFHLLANEAEASALTPAEPLMDAVSPTSSEQSAIAPPPSATTTPSTPSTFPTDHLIKNERDAGVWRKYHQERVRYMQTHKGIPASTLAKAKYAQGKFEQYLLNKHYIKSVGAEIGTPLLSSVLNVVDRAFKWLAGLMLPNRAYAYLFGTEDFESCGSLPCSFDGSDQWGSVTPSLDSTSKVTGVKSLKEVVSGEGAGSFHKAGLSRSEVWVSFKIWVPNPVTWGASGFVTILDLQDINEGHPMWLAIEDYGTPRLTLMGDVFSYTDTGLNLTAGTVNTIQLRLKTGTTNGDVDLWLNNNSQGSPSYNGSGTLNIGSAAIDTILAGFTYVPESGVSTSYFDDITIDSAFISASSNTTPTSPTSLLSEGQTNPTNITDPTPEFSALYNDPDSGDVANKYRLQVSTSSTNWSSPKWDSGTTSMASTTAGQRSPDISYTGSALASSTTYYWRIALVDKGGLASPWSSTASFSLAAGGGGGSADVLQNISYTYDNVGNITKIVDASQTSAAGTTTYAYDPLNRLVGATTTQSAGGDYTQSYIYSAIGNITAKSSDVGSYTYAGNQGASYANPHAATQVATSTYTYDNNGNLTADGLRTNSWDYQNRLTQTVKGGTTYRYAYDHSGQRTAYFDGTATTTYANKYFDQKGSAKFKHLYAGSDLVATIDGAGSQGGTSTPAYVQSAKSSIGGSVTLPSAVTQGNLIVVGLTVWNQSIPANAITDSKGNTYTKVANAQNGTDRAAIFYAKNVVGGSSFSVFTSVGGTVSAHEYSGVATSSPFDKAASSTGSSATPSSGNVTTTTAGELYFGTAWSTITGDTWTPGPGYTLREQETDNDSYERLATEDKVVGAATTTAATFTTPSSNAWAAVIATFKPLVTQGGGAATAIHYAHLDHLGGTNVVSNASGTLEETLAYYPFGSSRIDQKVGSFEESKKFTGHEYDTETGLYFMQARYQLPTIGRFVSQDPSFLQLGTDRKKDYLQLSQPQRLNSYTYADNNPVTNIDPDGKDAITSWFAYNGNSGINAYKQQAANGMTMAVGLPAAIATAPAAVGMSALALGELSIGAVTQAVPAIGGAIVNTAIRAYNDLQDGRIDDSAKQYAGSATIGALDAVTTRGYGYAGTVVISGGFNMAEGRYLDGHVTPQDMFADAVGSVLGKYAGFRSSSLSFGGRAMDTVGRTAIESGTQFAGTVGALYVSQRTSISNYVGSLRELAKGKK